MGIMTVHVRMKNVKKDDSLDGDVMFLEIKSIASVQWISCNSIKRNVCLLNHLFNTRWPLRPKIQHKRESTEKISGLCCT